MPSALAAALTDAPSRLAPRTAITMSSGCVVTPDEISSDARSASTDVASVCIESGVGLALPASTEPDTFDPVRVSEGCLNCAFALEIGACADLCIARALVPIDTLALR